MIGVKLSVGDFSFIGFGLAATAMMLVIGPGRRDLGDLSARLRSNQAYLRRITRGTSPVLNVAMIVALGAVAYVLIAVYAKGHGGTG